MKQESRAVWSDLDPTFTQYLDANIGTGPYERGLWVSEGRPRSNVTLEDFFGWVKRGDTNKELVERSPSLFGRHARHLGAIRAFNAPTEWRKKTVTVIHGGTGLGKSRQVWETAAREGVELYKCSQSYKGWFDGYCGQRWALFDDFHGQIEIGEMLNLLDGYPHTVGVKGDTTPWYPEVIYLTSNLHPKDWYPKATQEHIAALLRRIDTITELGRADTRVATAAAPIDLDQPTIVSAYGARSIDFTSVYTREE